MMLPTKKLLGHKTLLLLATGFTVLCTIAFLMPGENVPPIGLPIDKVVHVGIHTVLVFLWLRYASGLYKRRVPKLKTALIILGCLLYGIVIELIQENFVPLRHADAWDLAANCIGLVLGVLLFYKTRNYFGNQI